MSRRSLDAPGLPIPVDRTVEHGDTIAVGVVALEVIHLRGHTPGSIAINLKDGGRQACFSGDIMHHPIQVYHPDWSSQFCSDQELSAKSRRKLLEDCSESNALLCPAHFPGANAGFIKPAGNAFKIEWDVVK